MYLISYHTGRSCFWFGVAIDIKSNMLICTKAQLSTRSNEVKVIAHESDGCDIQLQIPRHTDS